MLESPPRRSRIRLDPRVYSQPGVIALLTACTNKKRPLFKKPDAADLVTEEIRTLHSKTWQILGFCVMPTHVHLLALNVDGSLLDLMKRPKGRVSTRLRGQIESPLWQRAFHDHILRRNEDINRTIRYLLENPVRAGFVDQWTQYRWSGSPRWPEIDESFFSHHPSDVIWSEVFAFTECQDDPDSA